MSASGDFRRRISSIATQHKKLLHLCVLCSAVVIICVAAITLTQISGRRHDGADPQAVLRSACRSTRFRDLCLNAVAADPSVATSLNTTEDVITATLNKTVAAVQRAYFDVKRLADNATLSVREKTALHDCLENIDDTLDELRETVNEIRGYPSKRPTMEQAEQLKILVSAAMTNQRSCMDGFSHGDDDKNVSQAFSETLEHVYMMCSNALAIISKMTDKDLAAERERRAAGKGRRLNVGGVDGGGFPNWLSAGDRKLLQDISINANAVVAADGTGDYRTVSAAVDAAPVKSKTRWIIWVKAGVYEENVDVPKKKTNIMLIGDGRKTTIITGSRNVRDGSTTFRSATVAVTGERFLARDITFQNTAGPTKHQAVALRVGSDLSAFYRCDMLGYQDTLYVHSLRQFYRSCLVVGTVDFIFGNAAAVFQDCDIHARLPNSGQKNMITAQGRDDPNQNTGIVIRACRIGATSDLRRANGSFMTYLGRPWKEYSRTAVMRSIIDDVIPREGWAAWSGSFALGTLYYAEYQNTGAGAVTSERVTWKGFKVLTNLIEAQQFTAGNFIVGDSWLASTGFPYQLGL